MYEHSLSCFKWLEVKKKEKKEGDEENKEDQEDHEETKEEQPEGDEKPINRAFTSILSDDTVELHDGEDVKEQNEVDMSKIF